MPDLTAIRVSEHGAYDQAVFQFANGIPHYSVGYVAAVPQDAKGTPAPLPGRSFLQVAFQPAAKADSAGPGTISPYFPTLLQISAAGDFEGYLRFGLGLSGRGGYRVYTLTHPGRVVIEFPHVTLPKFPGIWDITSWPQFWESQTAFENGHQPWLASPAMVVRAWAYTFSSQPIIRQTGSDTFQVTRREHAGEEPPLTVNERARLRELERETREQKMELEFLKKAAAYFARDHR